MVLGIWGALLLLPIICCSTFACLEEERISLLDFKQGINFTYSREYYKRFHVSPLESWRGLNCCAWEGVRCHPHNRHVLALDLSYSFIQWSEIRGGLFQLLHLEHLDLTGNYFISLSIPAQLGELKRLKYLSFFYCGFIGQIPRELTQLQQLEHLGLALNNLHGVIPRELTKLQQLEHLDLGYNNLHGVLPRELTKLQQLEHLDLGHNNLHGVIPRELSKLQQLEHLELGDNNLHGDIPREIGNMSSLKYLRLSWNKDLQSNKLEEWITHLRGLEQLRLGCVNFSMAGDGWVGNIASLTNLTALYMYGCGLTGEIPPSFANLSRLRELSLSSNSLRGIIPWNIGSLKGVIILNISRNHFNGKIPKSIGEMTMLQSLDLSHNTLYGAIPTELQLLTSLSYFDVSYNNLSGMIPQGGQMMTFDSRYFSNNSGLCGFQVNTSCSRGHPNFPMAHEETNTDSDDDIWWYMGMATGYVMSFSVVMGMLWLNKTWSATCFKYMDAIIISLFEVLREKL